MLSTALFLALALVARIVAGLSTTARESKEKQVEFELMTWPEVASALAARKITALFYTGGISNHQLRPRYEFLNKVHRTIWA